MGAVNTYIHPDNDNRFALKSQVIIFLLSHQRGLHPLAPKSFPRLAALGTLSRGAGEGDPPRRAGWAKASVQLLARNRDAVQEAAFAMIIVDCEVPGRAVVPKGQRAFPPLETAGELRPHSVAVQVVQQRT